MLLHIKTWATRSRNPISSLCFVAPGLLLQSSACPHSHTYKWWGGSDPEIYRDIFFHYVILKMPPVDCGNWYVPEVCAGSLRCDYIWSPHELHYIGSPPDCGLGDWRQEELDSYQIPILETEWRANVQRCYEQVEAWGEHFPSRMHREGG